MQQPQDVVELSITELADRARSLAASAPRTVLAVVGAPGAGKSTVCDALVRELGDAVALVGMDGFHLDNEVLIDLGRRDRKGAPDTFDVDGYLALLRRLRAADEEITYAPRFDRDTERTIGSTIPVPREVPLVLTEGNYLLHDGDGWDRVRSLLDQVWFIDVPDAERRRRLVARRLGHGHPRAEAEAWVDQVDGPNGDLVNRGRARADVIVQLREDS